MKLSCIVIEDEPLARKLIVGYVERVQGLHFKADFADAISALAYLSEHQVDVIFLDLHLPKLKGLEFIEKLHFSPLIIITTAYHQYALESYAYPVVDYLLKPIEFHRFEQAINKIGDYQHRLKIDIRGATQLGDKFIQLGSRQVKIELDNILYIESELEYLKIFRKDKAPMRIRQSMQGVLKVLYPLPLVRIHRSFTVVPSKVTSISSKHVDIDDISLPIGRQYRSKALKLLKTP